MGELIISKGSWHYRLLRKCKDFQECYGGMPKSLCSYFWSCVWFFPSSLFLATFLSALAAAFTVLLPIYYWSWLHNGSRVACIFAVAITGMWVIGGLLALHFHFVVPWLKKKSVVSDYVYTPKDNAVKFNCDAVDIFTVGRKMWIESGSGKVLVRIVSATYDPKTDQTTVAYEIISTTTLSLIWQFLASTKHKMCPLIKYVN